jgi:predicted transglutaminase-like cysteine proteinase
VWHRQALSAALLSLAVLATHAIPATAERSDFAKLSSPREHNNQSLIRRKSKMPPFAYIKLCVEHPSSCKTSQGRIAVVASGQVKLNRKLRSQLASVNSSVNRAIRPKRDSGGDTWTVGAKSGDCEDYVLSKRAKLIAMGWPSRALAIAVVRTRGGQGHAVLVVNTDQGRLILDNLVKDVRSKNRSPHRFVSMQDTSSTYGWTRY